MEEGGSPSDHPSILAFLVGVDGKVTSSLMNNQQYNASGFNKWLEDAIKDYEKAHPRTRLPFMLADVSTKGSGTGTMYFVEALQAAHDAGGHVMLFFGRDRFEEGDKAAKKQNRATKSFCKKVLDSKTAEKYAAGWTFLRFDMADEGHAGYAASLEVTEAPTLLVWLAGDEKPTVIGPRPTPTMVANVLKKNPVEGDD